MSKICAQKCILFVILFARYKLPTSDIFTAEIQCMDNVFWQHEIWALAKMKENIEKKGNVYLGLLYF